MTKIDTEKVLEWINNNWVGSKECQICGQIDWVIMEEIWQMGHFVEGKLFSSGPILPLVALMCNSCGYTIFFNAIAVKAVKRPGEEGGKNE